MQIAICFTYLWPSMQICGRLVHIVTGLHDQHRLLQLLLMVENRIFIFVFICYLLFLLSFIFRVFCPFQNDS
jgi:hypothetical protein